MLSQFYPKIRLIFQSAAQQRHRGLVTSELVGGAPRQLAAAHSSTGKLNLPLI